MPERSHLSIGEVLSLLREEFPDVTISKIRFLESQGLVDPERTPSGYRKFYEHDVERLRWILQQQREHFLPLKVIRGRLSEHEDGPGLADSVGTATAEPGAAPAGAGEGDAESGATGAESGATGAETGATAAEGEVPGEAARNGAASPEAGPGVADNGGGAAEEATGEGPGRAPASVSAGAGEPGGGAGTAQAATATRGPRSGDASAVEEDRGAARAGEGSGEDADAYTVDELAARSGASPALVADLRQYGLVTPRSVVAGVAYFDREGVQVARAAAGLARHGVEARHLRPWRNGAEREAALFEQVVMPLLRQRNPQARREAAAVLEELARFGGELREVLVKQALRDVR